MPILRERAPAKINLTLHVEGRRADGFHLLVSLVAFAALADDVTLEPGDETSLSLAGPTAGGAGALADNLVLKAASALAARVPGLIGGCFRLVKRLPVAAGIGGGSSDAAAALRLLARANGLELGDARMLAAARATGADVPVCLEARTRFMRGTGDELSPPLVLPRLPAILVYPSAPTPTAAVFRRLTELRTADDRRRDGHPAIDPSEPKAGLIEALSRARNDLEAPARLVSPVIAEAAALAAAQPGCRLARMSGSGATLFGLFDTSHAATAAAKALRAARPGWWVRSTVIG